MPKHVGVITIAFILFLHGAAAQTVVLHDSTLVAAAQPVVALLNASLGQSSALYNGHDYNRQPSGINSHAYLGINHWQPARILYDGMTFDKVPALYDMVKDELVILHFNQSKHVRLVKQKVAQFAIGGKTFLHLKADSILAIPAGFYHLLHAGKTAVIARRFKNIEERVTPEQVERRYVQRDRFYLVTNGTYLYIRNEDDMLAAFGDHRKTLQQYLRKSKLRFRKDPENTLVQATIYYDSINN